MKIIPCEITPVGKRRDGKMRHWCLSHRANATGKYGVRLEQCVKANLIPPSEEETFRLNFNAYPGGIALWGAVPAVYDTTRHPVDRGIHLHAREKVGGEKVVDHTYRHLVVRINDKDQIDITEEEAIYYMTAVVMGHDLKFVVCKHCDYPHLDKDVLAVYPHRKHLCAGCGRDFYDSEVHIGNPIIKVKEVLGDIKIHREVKKTQRVLDIQQSDFPGGIQIWGSNQGIIWTAPILEEEGIHVHCFTDQHKCVVDDTFGTVIIDGQELSANMVRAFMAQAALPHLRDSLMSLSCTHCGFEHFDEGELKYIAHPQHSCARCGELFTSPYRKKNAISNPIIDILAKLENNALTARQSPFLDLLPEGKINNND